MKGRELFYSFLTFTISGLIVSVGTAQNLVPNYSFEEIDDCDITLSTLASGWTSASVAGSPDLFHECATDSFFTTPFPLSCDSLVPRTGIAYAGLIVYGEFSREYLQIALTEVLEKDQPYYVAFYVSPTKMCLQSLARYTDGIGLAITDRSFSDDPPLPGNDPLPISPFIERRGTVLDNVGTWTRISGCYVAQGGESHILIGNFLTDSETLLIAPAPWSVVQNYLYIDDVHVEKFDPLPDTMLLCTDQLDIEGEFLDSALLWSTGKTGKQITVTEPGMYTVELMLEGCLFQDTTMVVDARTVSTVTFRDSICPGTSLKLIPPVPGEYKWSDGSKSSSIVIHSPGFYTCSVTNVCGNSVFKYDVVNGECECSIYVANSFSPNGDGINDYLEAHLSCNVGYTFMSFHVFNRWGQEVYAADVADFMWDGRYRGDQLPSGVYVWMLKYQLQDYTGVVTRTTSGDITVLR